MLSDLEIKNYVLSEMASAVSHVSDSELSNNRATLLDYYNLKPYGDEKEGQSQIVTSDVADVIEWMLPSLLRIFTQGRNVAKFYSYTAEGEQEAREKTLVANHEFLRKNKGVMLLHNMMKDALLQYTGVIKVSWDDTPKTERRVFKRMSDIQRQALLIQDNISVISEEQREDGTYDFEVEVVDESGRIRYDVIPPEEFLINSDARDFNDPRFIGHQTPKSRSELIKMGFDKDVVNNLPADEPFELTEEKQARYEDIRTIGPSSTHHPNDIIYVGEAYVYMDVDEDDISELWQVFVAGNEILDKQRVDEHPFCVIIPIPIPHRAIGSCPAEQVADLQYWKSTLVRQMNNNIAAVNYNRYIANEAVNFDDLLNPVPGGVVRVESQGPVNGAIQEITTTPQSQVILQGIEYVDTTREIRTGMTRYSQGMDGESLNKTATGFMGIKDASQQRIELIARLFADTGIKDIFCKTVKLLGEFQDKPYRMSDSGRPVEIDMRAWRSMDIDCNVDVGLGAGDRIEKIQNLNYVLQLQQQYLDQGLMITDQKKLYNTLSKLITEVGLKDESVYFNDPEKPEELLLRQNEILLQQVQLMQQQLSGANQLAEAEAVSAQGELAKEQMKQEHELAKEALKQENQKEIAEMKNVTDLTELELKYNQDVPGAAV